MSLSVAPVEAGGSDGGAASWPAVVALSEAGSLGAVDVDVGSGARFFPRREGAGAVSAAGAEVSVVASLAAADVTFRFPLFGADAG